MEDAREEPVEQSFEVIRAGGAAITRRRLLGAAGGAAGLALGAAALAPLASLGPAVGDSLRESPWHDGVPLVDEDDQPVSVAELEDRSYLTAFPKGADKEARESQHGPQLEVRRTRQVLSPPPTPALPMPIAPTPPPSALPRPPPPAANANPTGSAAMATRKPNFSDCK